MESLNDIMNRAAQHRQHLQERHAAQQDQDITPQEQRTKQSPARRSPLPEQTARLGQPLSPRAPELQASSKYPQQTSQEGSGRQGYRPISKFPPPNTTARDQMPRRDNVERRPANPRYEQQPPQETGHPGARAELRSPATSYQREMASPKVVRDFYEPYPALPPADVQEEWDDDEASMRFGDWETEATGSGQRYPQTEPGTTYVAQQDAAWQNTRVVNQYQASAPLVTRETPLPPAREPAFRSPLTRNLREERAAQTQPPAPQALPQESQRYQRITQPLNPRVIAGVSQQPSREVEIYERAQQLPSVSTSPQIGPKSACPTCKGAGFLRADVPFGHPNFGKPIACECKEAERREKRRRQLLELSDLGAFHNKNFENFIVHSSGIHASVQEAYQEAWRFAQSPDGWFVLIGPNGCGKTHLAAAIANQNLSDGAVVLFTVVPELLAHLRATFSPTSTEPYDQRFAKMREAELLVLDDLGSHQSSPWANEKLFQLLNYRYNSGYPTVITANKQGLMGLDERILSRLNDNALVIRVELKGAIDFRPHNPRREPRR
jgi:DNA replication protein DnaC